jgi:5-methyltetrahydropteroyltriglutamate--homocysteine methyltransferase
MATAHRAEVIGSLLLPAYLKEARARHAAGAIGYAVLKRVEDRAGNNQSKYIGSGAYDPIAAKVFRASRFQRFLLEYDDARSGGFEPLWSVPGDRTVVLGLVTTKRPALESRSELQRRIREAAAFVALEQLALSPQCGFASTEEGNLITPADQDAKLALVTETAREVWGGA